MIAQPIFFDVPAPADAAVNQVLLASEIILAITVVVYKVAIFVAVFVFEFL